MAYRSWILPAVIVTGLGAAALLRGGGAPAGLKHPAGGALPGLPAQTPATSDFGSAEQLQGPINTSRTTAIVLAARRVAPTVVSVNITRREAVQPRSLFESFFLPPGAEQTIQGLGSGFIIRQDGLILTNEHVVRGADQVAVTLPDGRQFQGKVLGTDDVTDLALVRIAATGLPVAPLGSSDSLMIGEWVIAIGNPFGFLLSNTEPTVTAGVVSGVDRNIIGTGGSSQATSAAARVPASPGAPGAVRVRPAQARGEGDDDQSRGYYLGMIQTDAAINPGNSGGPLINALGQVIGVNSSILSQSGGSEGLGFAIPIDRARRIVGDLLAYGHVRRAWAGLEVGESSTPQWGMARRVTITHVAGGSPAAQAGLTAGMTVLAAGGHAVHSALDWEGRLLDARIGATLPVTIDAPGGARVVQVVPRDLPSVASERVRALSDFELVTVTPAIRSERSLSSESGALIVSLSDNARDIGFEEGDVVVQVNRFPVRRAEDAAALLRRFAGRGPVRVLIERDGQLMSISFYVS